MEQKQRQNLTVHHAAEVDIKRERQITAIRLAASNPENR